MPRREYVGAAGLLQVMSMYRRLVVVMNPQSARACPEWRAKARLVRKSCTDCRGAVRMEVLWAAASSRSEGKLVSSVGGRTRGSLGKTERMEV